ncbi:hypothetical protein V1509DRAFT_653086 [Lipomyces kononenkoae]
MVSVGLVLFVLTAFTITGFGLPNPPKDGYGVEELSWKVEVFPGQAHHVLNGTIQHVYNQVMEINPGFQLKPNSAVKKRQDASRVSPLKKRQTLTNYYCDNFPPAQCGPIADGINYLIGVSGQPVNGPGPGNCGQVSCSYDSAIWWCNDNPTTYTLASFIDIAALAQDVVNDCAYGDCLVSFAPTVAGQQFTDQDWNVIVRNGIC